MNQAFIKDALRRIEDKLDKVLEEKNSKPASGVPSVGAGVSGTPATSVEPKVVSKVNTGQGGRG